MKKLAQFYTDGLVTVSIESKNGSLFHYTKTIDSLCEILETGFRFSYCFEEQDESTAKCLIQSSTELMKMVGSSPIQYGIAMPMICFCDIPISKALNHRQQYGNYCIGLDKEKCRKALPALNPILYMSSNWIKEVIESFVNALPTMEDLNLYKEKIQEITSPAENMIEAAGMINKATAQGDLSDNIKYNTRLISAILELLSIVKPYESNDKCYYNEHEWRVYYTPAGYAKYGITRDDYNKDRLTWNTSIWENKEYGYIVFENPQDIITHIIVQNDDEIHSLVSKISKSEHIFGKRLSDEQKSLLISKITSFARVSCDF